VTRYVLTLIAEEDIGEIAAWIAGHNRIVAERFVDAAYAAFSASSALTRSARPCNCANSAWISASLSAWFSWLRSGDGVPAV
jgi:plasmid stabilization system protein ParE